MKKKTNPTGDCSCHNIYQINSIEATTEISQFAEDTLSSHDVTEDNSSKSTQIKTKDNKSINLMISQFAL